LKTPGKRLLTALGIMLLTSASYASTLRCGSQLISVGDRAFDVEQKCGVPVSQEVIGSKETFNSTYRKSEEVRIEEWIYGPENGMYQYLRFEGGRLVSIDSQRRQ
jgi:hypothetical protein